MLCLFLSGSPPPLAPLWALPPLLLLRLSQLPLLVPPTACSSPVVEATPPPPRRWVLTSTPNHLYTLEKLTGVCPLAVANLETLTWLGPTATVPINSPPSEAVGAPPPPRTTHPALGLCHRRGHGHGHGPALGFDSDMEGFGQLLRGRRRTVGQTATGHVLCAQRDRSRIRFTKKQYNVPE
jgi:hypothetical protein